MSITTLYPRVKKKIKRKDTAGGFDFTTIKIWDDFAKLVDIRSGQNIVKFNPYDYQSKLIKLVEQHKSIVICKTRQLGITETLANYFLYYACKYEGYLGVIFSKTQSDTSNIAKRLRRQIESLNLQTKNDSLTDIEFYRGGRILFRNSTPYGSRGLESVSHILFDEASFIDELEEIYKSALPCTSMVENSKVILLSTPNGTQGFYFRLLAENNNFDLIEKCGEITNKKEESFFNWVDKREWLKVLIHWYSHPIYSTRENYLDTIKNQFGLTQESVNQEYNLSFSSSDCATFSHTLVQSTVIHSIPDNFDFFICGLDSSAQGKDYTVLTVVGVLNDEYYLADYYRAREKTSDYHLFKIFEKLEEYSPRLVVVETNSIGQIYYEKISREYNCAGVFTSQKSKSEMIARFIFLGEGGKIKIPKKFPHLEELLNFRGGNQSSHDDCVMSLLLAIYGYDKPSPQSSRSIDLSKFYINP